MASRARYDYIDLKPPAGSFLDDVIAGLSAWQKSLSPKYFYDARGSALFEAICELPEYYPTRTELAMLHSAAPEMAARIGPRTAIVEYGSGASRKTPALIRALQPLAYVAIDISGEQLRSAVEELAVEFPEVRMLAVCADYTQAVPLSQLNRMEVKRRIIYFPGSTIGNFTPAEAHDFLVNAREVAGSGGAMLVGVDLKKDAEVLHAAYNDAQGVTAAFNLNLLRRINRELGADFDLDSFQHRAYYDAHLGRIEMHLISTREQQARVNGRTFRFEKGESIHTENSYKYTIDEFQTLARGAGFQAAYCWVDAHALFSIHYLMVDESTLRAQPLKQGSAA